MKLIVLEGCDGTGTSTNAKKLGEAIQREGYKTLVEGQTVEFDVGQGRKGEEAQNVVVVG